MQTETMLEGPPSGCKSGHFLNKTYVNQVTARALAWLDSSLASNMQLYRSDFPRGLRVQNKLPQSSVMAEVAACRGCFRTHGVCEEQSPRSVVGLSRFRIELQASCCLAVGQVHMLPGL